MNRKRAFISQESIDKIPYMSAEPRRNIQDRIMLNEDITRAKASQASREAGCEIEATEVTLNEAKELLNDYEEEK